MPIAKDCSKCGELIWFWQAPRESFQFPSKPDTRSWLARDLNSLITHWEHQPNKCRLRPESK